MVQFSHLRLYLGYETVSCHLLLWMTRMNMDLKLERLGHLCQVFMSCQQKFTEEIIIVSAP